jgi:hypothetical protein
MRDRTDEFLTRPTGFERGSGDLPRRLLTGCSRCRLPSASSSEFKPPSKLPSQLPTSKLDG